MSSSNDASAPSNASPWFSSSLIVCESARGVDDALEPMAELLGADARVRAAAELRHDESALVADEPRVDVLVAALDLGDRGAVDAALVRERGAADERLVLGRRDVRDLGDATRQRRQLAELAAADGSEREVGLEREVREHADHVRVAAALAVAVDRRLDVARARGDGGERVGDRELRVVVGVDAPGDRRGVGVGLERRARLPEDPRRARR